MVADLTAWTGPVTGFTGFYLEKVTGHSQTCSRSNFVKTSEVVVYFGFVQRVRGMAY